MSSPKVGYGEIIDEIAVIFNLFDKAKHHIWISSPACFPTIVAPTGLPLKTITFTNPIGSNSAIALSLSL